MSARFRTGVDTHCHLDRFPETERAGVIARAVQAGIADLVTIGTRLSQSAEMLAIARAGASGARIWCTLGTHPDHVDDEMQVTPEALAALAAAPEIIGIGESGLDYVVSGVDRERQRASFRTHARAARLAGVPLVVHARGADDDVATILREEYAQGPFDFVLHCFSSGPALAEAGLALGGHVSFSGILTFPKSDALRELASRIPAERLLVETDAPFLAPVPKRGRRNEPAFVVHTQAVLAALIGRSEAETGALVADNFRRLFRKAA